MLADRFCTRKIGLTPSKMIAFDVSLLDIRHTFISCCLWLTLRSTRQQSAFAVRVGSALTCSDYRRSAHEWRCLGRENGNSCDGFKGFCGDHPQTHPLCRSHAGRGIYFPPLQVNHGPQSRADLLAAI